jgi:hypothetical protein
MDERDKWRHLKLKVAETSVMKVEGSLATVTVCYINFATNHFSCFSVLHVAGF